MSREKWTRGFLWFAAIGWGMGVGGKLFEMMVVMPAWSASPPTSLALMPYGPRYPFNPGDFFLPLMALMLPGTFGALATGWKTPRSYRIWLIIPAVAFVLVAVFTPTVFWPMIRELYGAGTGRITMSEADAALLVRRWWIWDSARTVVSAGAYLSLLRALSVPYPRDNQ